MSTEVTASSVPLTTIATTANNPGLGTVGILPREVRDEIYRHLLKGHYSFEQFSLKTSAIFQYKSISRLLLAPETPCSVFAISQVSNAVYEEAASIMYAESFFRYHIGKLDRCTILRPIPVLDRASKIEFIFSCSRWLESKDTCTSVWKYNLNGTLDKLTGPGTLRNTLVVRFRVDTLLGGEKLPVHVLGRLKTFVGFRTVIVHTGLSYCAHEKEYCEETFKGFAEAIEREMVPTMGPATVRHDRRSTFLESHPLEYRQLNQST